MAEIVVGLVLDKLGPLIKEKAYLLKGIHNEVKEIKCDLECISAFLQDADVRAQIDQRTNTSHHGIKLWGEKLRRAAFQVEDVIDEYTYLMVQLQRPNNNRFIGFVRRNACLVVRLKPRHDITSKIQEIKKTIQKINKTSADFGFNSSLQQESTSYAQTNSWYDPRKKSRHLKETDVVGIESSINRLIVIEKGALYNLEELNIGPCAQLETSLGFRHLRNVKKVLLFDLQTKFLSHCSELIQFT